MSLRTRRLAALSIVVAAGLASRRWPLPGIFAEHTGDALYATAAWFLFGSALPRLRRRPLTLAAFAFSALVEGSQLLHPGWLDAVRATTVGRLLLGQGFQWADLLAYAIGAGAGGLLDVALNRGTRRATPTGAPPPARA